MYQNKRSSVFKNGLLFNMVRGEDATGVAGIREGRDDKGKFPAVTVYKRAIHAVDFMNTKGFSRFMNRFQDFYFVIGHVRASTIGGDLDVNAHPFGYDHITLAHNGTVNKGTLQSKADEEVDSAYIAKAIAEHGEKETLERLDGGYSLVWHNSDDDTLNFARNDRKPMAIAFVKGKNEMYYASEYRMLYDILGRNDITIDGNIRIPEIHTHYKFHKEDLRKWEVAAYKPFTRPTGRQRDPMWDTHTPATIHQPKSMVTHTPANASPAGSSTEIGQKSTSATATESGTDSKGTKASTTSSPSAERLVAIGQIGIQRQAQMNAILRKYGWGYEQRMILKPVDFVLHNQSPNGTGRMVLTSIQGELVQPAEVIFMMYRVTPKMAARFEKLGKVAVKFINFLDENGGFLRIIVEPDTDLQAVMEGSAEVIEKLKAHGFGPSEGSKSNGETIDAEFNPLTGELRGVPPDDLHTIEGANGSFLTPREFSELAKGGCTHCDGDIEPADHSRCSWHGSALICEKCTNNPLIQAELAFSRVH